MNRTDEHIPVTLVTGFLGAGKTTLLNHILESNPNKRFAIIENEFGDLGVDGSLVRAKSEVLFELNDGCICCTVREDLIEVFSQLLERTEEIDHVIIETTGLAEPVPVMRIFEYPEVRAAFTLDGVVTVVDAAHIGESLSDVDACEEQITYADLLILNKADRVGLSDLESVEQRLKKLNPLAAQVRAHHATVDSESVLNLGGRSEKERFPGHHHEHHHDHHHDDHEHDDEIGSVAVEAPGEVNVAELDMWLERLIRSPQPELIRMKGIIAVPGDPRRFVFNVVRQVVDVHPERPWESDERYNRIVFIGRGLEQTSLQEAFQDCLATS